MFNRELVNLYTVLIDDEREVMIRSKKIDNLFWLDWEKFVDFYSENIDIFTKTAQFYFSNKAIMNEIESVSKKLVNNIAHITRKQHLPVVHIDYFNTYKKTHGFTTSVSRILLTDKDAYHKKMQAVLHRHSLVSFHKSIHQFHPEIRL